MANKIAKVDADAMNSLYAAEVTGKTAAGNADVTDRNGAPEDPQAFQDHEEYIATLKSVMAEDTKTDFEPNDVTLD
jgi:hypothetical protein